MADQADVSPALFLAGDFLAAVFFVAVFLAGAFFAGAFFVVLDAVADFAATTF